MNNLTGMSLRYRRPSSLILSVAQETIAAQSDDFGQQLETGFAEIKAKMLALDPHCANASLAELQSIFKKINKEEAVLKPLEELIFKRLGLKVKFQTQYPTHGAILPLPVAEYHTLLGDWFKGHPFYQEQLKKLKLEDKDTGTIDLDKARVGGLFSQYTHALYINFGLTLFTDNLLPSEVTAIVLHELGHAFTFYEYSDRCTAANRVMSTVLDALKEKPEKRNYTYIYRQIQSISDLTDKDVDELLSTPNPQILTGRLALILGQHISHEARVSKYDQTSSEQLADQFSTRFGYGRALVTGLDKIMAKYSFVNSQAMYSFSLLVEAATIVGAFASLALVPGVLTGIIAGLVVMMMSGSGDNNRDMTYDDLKIRYTRIRNDLIQQLKGDQISPAETKNLIETIKVMDELILKTANYKSLFNRLGNLFFSANRSAAREIQYQQQVERLVANDLFLKSAELQTLS